MNKLSTEKYWDQIYSPKRSGFSVPFKSALRRFMRDYPNYLIWEKLLPDLMTTMRGRRVLEIGCAPGGYLVAFFKRFGMTPYGIEYSSAGCKLTRDRFIAEGLPPENIIEMDFFDDAAISTLKEGFDAVYSRGFIEHFDNPREVVERHGQMLKSGGLLIIQIPNLSGVNSWLSKRFNPVSHSIHNLGIMNLDAFCGLFPKERFEPLFCGYVGGFSFGLFNTNGRFKKMIHGLLNRIIQPLLNVVFRGVSRVHRFESAYTSPALLMIARKK